jgi:hypothetical protein
MNNHHIYFKLTQRLNGLGFSGTTNQNLKKGGNIK